MRRSDKSCLSKEKNAKSVRMTERNLLVNRVGGNAIFESEMYFLSENTSLVVSSIILGPFDIKFYKSVLKVNIEYCPKCGRRF